MGRQSTKENKTLYQIYREECGLTRERASELMEGMTTSRIERIENGQEPSPYDIIQMAECYKRPNLCNYYCSHQCEIGKIYVPEVEVSALPNIILETVGSLSEVEQHTMRLIQIARDGKITDDEIPDFAKIILKLSDVSLAIDALNLWVDRTVSENGINAQLLNEEIDKLKK